MSLFPESDIITREIESWSGFADSLQTEEDRNLFKKMLNECYEYSIAINAKSEPFPDEPLIMAYYCYNKKWSIGYYPKLLKKEPIEIRAQY